jgi:hydroxypyruvate reductase
VATANVDSVTTRSELQWELTEIYRAAIAAVEPALLVARALEGAIPGSREISNVIDDGKHAFILAVGKAAYAMASALEQRLGARMSRGLAVIPRGPRAPATSTRLQCIASAHPVPDQTSANAASAALELITEVKADDLLVVALSGGASAMFVAPAAGLVLDDKVATNASLLRSGATIKELNCVRKHLSAVKGGNLLRSIAKGARIVTLILSDVTGDDIATIGSGLTAPDPSTFADAIGILKRRRIWGRTPERVRDHLEKGVAGEIPETPKRGDPIFSHVTNLIIGSNRTAVDAAAGEAERRGYSVERWPELRGEADQLGRELAHHLAKIESPRVCVVAGGEPTVTVRGGGRGGRAQQCALAMAVELSEVATDARVAGLIAGSDGIDGPTDAAGAFAFSDTVARARAAGLDPATALKRNDAYTLFDSIGDLLRIGPTGTNVTDLFIGLANH